VGAFVALSCGQRAWAGAVDKDTNGFVYEKGDWEQRRQELTTMTHFSVQCVGKPIHSRILGYCVSLACGKHSTLTAPRTLFLHRKWEISEARLNCLLMISRTDFSLPQLTRTLSGIRIFQMVSLPLGNPRYFSAVSGFIARDIS
jgi:hypothetical protein